MARPMPSPVTVVRANRSMVVTSVSRLRIANEIRIESPASSRGRAAAMSVRKTNSRSRSRTGAANSSIRRVSPSDSSPTWKAATAVPPATTPGSPSNAFATSSPTSKRTAPASRCPSTRERPSASVRRGSEVASSTAAMPGSAPSLDEAAS